MSFTESKLWESLAAAFDLLGAQSVPLSLTRIESPSTALGIADVEYVSPTSFGWLELKVTATVSPMADSVIRLQHPISMEQIRWLGTHTRETMALKSYALIGVRGPGSRWAGFILVPPQACVLLLPERDPPTLAKLLFKHCHYADTPLAVLHLLGFSKRYTLR